MRRPSARRACDPAPDRPARWEAGSPAVEFETPDPRADGGRRRVALGPEGVAIARALDGAPMRLALPFRVFLGVALEVERRGAFGVRLAVRLVHRDPELDVLLYEADHDRDVTAEWQHWSARCGLPMLVREADGRLTRPFGQCGALAVEAPRPRRMPVTLTLRRPRFLARRRTGALPAVPVVHREREIIARE